METSETKSTNGNGRKALGRGLEALLPEPATEEVRAGEAIPAIIRTLAGLPDRQVENIFRAVAAIKRTAAGESVAEIGAKFEALDRERIRREAKRHGWRFWKER